MFRITFQEGPNRAAFWIDLPASTSTFVFINATIDTIGSQINATEISAGQTAHFADLSGDGEFDRAVFDFGEFTNVGDNVVDEGDVILAFVTIRATDGDDAVVGGSVFEVVSSLNFTSGLYVESELVEIVEPALAIHLGVNSTFVNAEFNRSGLAYNDPFGDTILYSVTIAVPIVDNAQAYDVNVTLDLWPELVLYPGTVSTSDDGDLGQRLGRSFGDGPGGFDFAVGKQLDRSACRASSFVHASWFVRDDRCAPRMEFGAPCRLFR